MWNRLALTLITTLGLVLASSPAASAQSFDSLPGLERAVVRAWLAPAMETVEETLVDLNDLGTPIGTPTVIFRSTPDVPTPDPATVSAVVFLGIGVFAFDTEDHAVSAFESLADYVTQVSDADEQFAGGSRTSLADLGDQSLHATSTLVQEDIPFSFLLTTVREGTTVYLLQGTFVRVDATAEAERLVSSLLAGTAGEGDGTYSETGDSTGGLWDLFVEVEPVMLPGTEVFDSTIKAAAGE